MSIRETIVAPVMPRQAETTAGSLVTGRLAMLAANAAAFSTMVKAASKASRMINALAATSTGVSSALSGNPLAVVPLASGIKEIVSVMTEGPSVDIHNIAQDVRASAVRLEMLSKENKESCEVVNRNLDQIDQAVENLNQKLTDIRSIATQGNAKIEAQKAEAMALSEKSKGLFASATEEFEKTAALMDKARMKFINVSGYIDSLPSLLVRIQNKSGDVETLLAEFVQTTIQGKNLCSEGVEVSQEAMASLARALELVNLAHETKAQAFEEAGKAIQMSTDTLAMISAKAEAEQRIKNLVHQARQEVDIMNQRGQDIDFLIADLHLQMDKLEKNATSGASWGEIFAGVMIGGWIAPVIGASQPVASALVVGGIMVANQRNHLLGLKPDTEYSVRPLKTRKIGVSSQFGESTGIWGRYFEKRRSRTVGKVTLQVGNEEVSVPFNAKLEGGSKISNRHMLDLLLTLSSKVKNGQITAEECLSLIADLEIMALKTEEGKPSGLVGFVPPNSPYFNELKRQCRAIIASRVNA